MLARSRSAAETCYAAEFILRSLGLHPGRSLCAWLGQVWGIAGAVVRKAWQADRAARSSGCA